MQEYITIQISSGSVTQMSPNNAQTQSAHKPEPGGTATDLATVLTKMGEYGYALVPGIVVPVNDITCIIVMQRET